jgi:hypothetical protein
MHRRLLAAIAVVLALIPGVAWATVNTSANKTIALGNGSQTQFTFSFIGDNCAYINVIYTDALGNQTTLTQGTGSTQFQCALNSVPQGGIWGVGGTITYNPNSAPIATGTTLTIYRSIPLTQAITLQNQVSVSVLGKGAEQGLDTGVMQGQQINEAIGRALQMNITNSAPPLPLPPATQLANLGLCADSTGNNIIGCSLPSSGAISSAMQPVVDAASLAAGRLAFGLGSMSQENVNGGTCGGATIQDDGSAGGANGVGYARVVFATVSDSTNQSVACSFHMSQRIATGPITYTLARANTLFNGFAFTIYVSSGLITLTPNAADNFRGVASGSSVNVAAGAACFVTTNAASSGLWELNCNNSPPSLSSSVSSNALTLTLNGTLINFRDPASCSGSACANGDPLWAIPTGNLSITIPATATLGTSNSVPFRGWLFAAYNSGTPVLGVATCSISTAIYPCAAWETVQKSGTAITTGSSTAGTLYTASSISNDAVRIIGYFEYGSGLSTAGTWATAPTTLQLCIPPFHCKRPGDEIQRVYVPLTTPFTTTSTSFTNVTGLAASLTPTSAADLVEITALVSGGVSASAGTGGMRFTRGSTGICTATTPGNRIQATTEFTSFASANQISTAPLCLDAPGTTSSTTYNVQVICNQDTVYVNQTRTDTNSAAFTRGYSYIQVREIMGALEPANDNPALKAVG